MQGSELIRMTLLFVALSFINSSLSYSQTGKPLVQIKIDTDNYVVEQGRKSFLSSCNLYTVIRGREYFIDHLTRGAVAIPEPLVDPTGSYVFYATNTGCGFEQEGMTIFVSDVYGKTKLPLLGRCWYLRPVRFLSFRGKNYLLIAQTSESPERSFWLYDLSRKEFVVHADGEIRERNKGVFSYGYYESDDKFKQIGKVTMETLIRRGSPLRLLPRYPTYGFTKERDTRVYPSDVECFINDESSHKTISKAGTRVLILAECEDGGYEIYYDRYRGKVKSGAVKAIQFGLKRR